MKLPAYNNCALVRWPTSVATFVSSHRLAGALLAQYKGRIFATTYNDRMKATLEKAGFVKKGEEWKGRKYLLEYEAVMTRPQHLAACGLSAEVGHVLDDLAAVARPVRLAF